MANYLASIFGTEADKVNCSFYYKIGACRHGDRCSRKHVKPSYSQTILLPNLYQNPAYDPKIKMNPSQLQNHFDAFYEDFWCEMCKVCYLLPTNISRLEEYIGVGAKEIPIYANRCCYTHSLEKSKK